ncbi:mitochondrial processing peptidase beta subunit [Culex quinquefasciatus]|uniref:Mitochondrial processing peptidase beta subunit n=1 Tax=Culex quinquefasciatus TaxID=7176 RepID=B0XDS7_CULQU|nr:mitochondrial processing peptidase beta subunit [Culex quinquefasciatus]|eukprot:XP_001867799.1 mitochondrial processing peptidase beta subunit [Culex quinquefasciatus]
MAHSTNKSLPFVVLWYDPASPPGSTTASSTATSSAASSLVSSGCSGGSSGSSAGSLHRFALQGPRIVLAAASGIKQGALLELIESYLGKVGSTFDGKASALTPCRFTDSEVRDRDDSLLVALVIIAVLICGRTNQDNVPLMVANTLISAWYRTQSGGAKNAEDNLCF